MLTMAKEAAAGTNRDVAHLIPVFEYAVKSLRDEEEGGSVTQQHEAEDAWIEEQGGRYLAGRYGDDNASGYLGNRGDGLAEGMKDCERAAALAKEKGTPRPEFLVTENDRFARGEGKHGRAKHLLWYGNWAYEHGIDLRAVDPEDDEDLHDWVKMATAGEANAAQSRRTGVKTRRGHRARRRNFGLQATGKPLLGYDQIKRSHAITDEEKRLGHTLDKTERGKIRGSIFPGQAESQRHAFNVFKWAADEHAAIREMARRLDDAGVPPRHGGKHWRDESVKEMIRNPFYIGYLQERIFPLRKPGEPRPPFDPNLQGNPAQEWNVLPGSQETFIPLDLWIRANQHLDTITFRRGAKGGNQPVKPFLVGGDLPVVCGLCGGAFGPVSTHDSYECRNHNRRRKGDPKRCSMLQFRRDVLEGMLLRWTVQVGLDPEGSIAAHKDGFAHERAVAASKLDQVDADLAQLALDDQDMWERYKRNNDEDDWRRWKAEYKANTAALEAQRDQFQKNVEALASTEQADNAEAELRALFAEIAARIEQRDDLRAIRALMKRLFAQFVIYPFDKVPDGVPIHDTLWDVESQRVIVPITEPAVTLGIRVQIGGYAWQAVPGHGLAPQVRPILKKQVLGGSW